MIVATPIALRLGWLAAMTGIVLGVAVGALAGVLWAMARQAESSFDERWS